MGALVDDAHIRQLAQQHRHQVDAARLAANARTDLTPREVWERHIGTLMSELGHAAEAYCQTYNAAVGSEKLAWDNDAAGINVTFRSRPLDGARLHVDRHSLSRCALEIGGTDEPVDLEVRPEKDALILRLGGQVSDPETVIMRLLDRFTTRMTEVECSEL